MNEKPITHLDLFSGIGGFALAADWVWGRENVEHVFCDNNDFSQAIIRKHWPSSEIYGDIRTVTNAESEQADPAEPSRLYAESRLRGGDGTSANARSSEQRGVSGGERQALPETGSVYLLTGGFPCQPFSQAGRRKGTGDDNGNGDALHSGERCDIIGVCNGDTTTSVRDAGNSRGEGKEGAIANPVQPNTKPNGEQKTSNEEGHTTESGPGDGKTKSSNDMEGNVSVAERATSPSSQSTTSTAGETRSGGNTPAGLGRLSSTRDTRTPIKSSATTATTPNTTSESAHTNDEGIYLLTGGFPCQPFSQAGRRKGTTDDRFLWPEMLRVIREFKPRWIIAENVAGLLTIEQGMVFEQVCTDLEGEGYAVQAFVIPAVAVNAPHRRDRIWFVAHAEPARAGSEGGTVANERGRPSEDRRTGIRQTHGQVGASGTESADSDAPDSKHTGLERKEEGIEGRAEYIRHDGDSVRAGLESGNRSWNENWLEVATRLCRVDDGVRNWVDGRGKIRNSRNNRLKALGNAIVPAVAEQIMHTIRLVDESI